MTPVQVIDLGTMSYSEALLIQEKTFEKVRREEIADTLLLVEHSHTYTTTAQSNLDDMLFSKSELAEKNIEVFEIRRGGEITYHGFGQLVVYPILNMTHFYRDVHRYLRDLEEIIIGTLKKFEVDAGRRLHPDLRKNYTGVWVNDEKICAIGVRFAHWTTMHGLALNVNTDLTYFDGIVPCGIRENGVTSLAKILHRDINFSEVKKIFLQEFAKHFCAKLSTGSLDLLRTQLQIV
jgi:lipoyl(octanoyl) transferase